MIELIIIIVCILLNGFLSLSEMAFVSVGKSKIRQLAKTGNTDAQRLLLLRESPERTLSVIQVGITLLGAIAAATAGVAIEEVLNPIVEAHFTISPRTLEVIGVFTVVIPLTYFSVVVGELVPKSIALRNPDNLAADNFLMGNFLVRA